MSDLSGMDDAERSLLLKLAWFTPDRTLLGMPARPYSLATHHALRMMGLRLLDREHDLSPEEEYRELRAYIWLHCEPVAVISESLWCGKWREMIDYECPDEPPMEMLSEWREARERLLSLLEASEISIRPRPRSGEDKTPFEVRGPDEMAHWLAVVARATGRPDAELLWEMPLYQLRQHYHAEMRWHGFWTVRPAQEIPEAEFEGFGEMVMGNLAGEVE